MTEITKTEVFICPGGHYETTKERAIARWLVDLCTTDAGNELPFSVALQLCKKSQQVKKLLDQLPSPEFGTYRIEDLDNA